MKAVILSTINTTVIAPLNNWYGDFLLPIANKPIVEHLIELLANHNVKEIILVLRTEPYETEQYFGKGERFGVEITYSLEKNFVSIEKSLTRLSSKLTEPFLFFPANIVTNLNVSDFIKFYENKETEIVFALDEKTKKESVFSPFILNEKVLQKEGWTLRNLRFSFFKAKYDFEAINSADDYWEVSQKVLSGMFEGIIIGYEKQKGFWLGARSKISSSAQIKPPVVIGKNCIIGNHATIEAGTILGNDVVIDSYASVESSIVFDNSYIGSHISIKDSLVMKNNLFDMVSKTNVFVSENFIIGDAKRELISSSQNRFLNLFLASFLFALFSPIFLLLYFYHLLSPSKRYFCTQEMFSSFEVIDLVGTSEPKAFSLYLFNSKIKFFRKIPGLINVIKGDLCVVGNAPLTEEETKLITEKWQKLRFEAPIGLFHFWEVESKDEPTWEEKITMDNFYAQTRSFGLDLKILFKHFLPKF